MDERRVWEAVEHKSHENVISGKRGLALFYIFGGIVRIFKIIALIVVFQLGAAGQQIKYVFNVLKTLNGLSSNNIRGVYQDKKGFIWVGTPNGIQRFDGKTFVNFPFINSSEFNSKPVNQIIGDDEGRIWLKVGESYGIFNPKNYQFNEIKVEGGINDKVQSYLNIDSDHNVILIYMGMKAYCYDKKLNMFTSKLPFAVPQDFTLNCYAYDKERKQYWLAGTKGIVIYDKKSNKIIDDKSSGIEILDKSKYYNVNKLTIDRENRLWMFYWPEPTKKPQKIGAFDLNIRRLINPAYKVSSSGLNYKEAKNLFQLSNGQLWLTGRNILASFDKDSLAFINYKSSNEKQGGINYFDINSTIEDREGIMWIATDNGLYTANTNIKSISILQISEQPRKFDITDLLVDENKIFLTTWGSGLVVYDKTFKYSKDVAANIRAGDKSLQWCIVKSKLNDKFYTGCQHGWLKEQDKNGKAVYFNFPIFNKKTIRQVVQDEAGNLWFGTHGGRLIMFNPLMGFNDNSFILKGEFNTIINRLIFDNHGKLWVATGNSGIIQYDPSSNAILRHYSNDQRAYKKIEVGFTDITQINDTLFGVAGNNFYLLNTKRDSIRKFSYYEGLASNNVVSLTTDDSSNVWMYTTNGISRYNFRRNTFTRYTEKDGFLPFEETDNRAKKLADGKIMLAGGGQIITFDPNEFNKKIAPPNVTITDLKLFNTYIPLDSLLHEKEIRFEPQQNSITIYFSSLSYTQGDKIHFYYRLKGGGEDWQLSNADNFVSYSLLPPGHYTFEVKCKNEQGDSSEITSLPFIISTPFYRTWWFIGLGIIIIILDGLYIYRSKENRKKAVENIRAKVARDLHDDMGSTLSTINILSTMAKAKLAKDTGSSELYLSKISENSQRMMEAMDDIVWSIKPTNDSMQKISSRMREFSTSVLEAKNIELEFYIDEAVNDVKLNMAARRDFFLLFKEAVNNLAKYSNSKTAFIKVGLENNRLILIVRDEGRGFDVRNLKPGNGISNMESRATNLKGKLDIKSAKNEGTEIKLTIPLN